MKNFKDRIPLLIKILAVVLLVLLCCNLPQQILFWYSCTKEDRNIPPNTEVIVSACKSPVATGVPGGEAIFVHETRTGRKYLLDLRNERKRKVPNDPLLLDKGIFLSSELVWLQGSYGGTGNAGYRPHYVLDLTTGKRYQLTDLSTWIDQPPPLDYGPYFKAAEQVFIYHKNNIAIALPPDFRQNPEGMILHKSQKNTETDYENGELLEAIMRDLGVKYQIVDLSLQYADIPSPTGRYVVRNDGIYLAGTNTAIVNREYTSGRFMSDYFKSWYYDESGVVVHESADYLIITPLGGRFIPIPHPILKLHLPVLSNLPPISKELKFLPRKNFKKIHEFPLQLGIPTAKAKENSWISPLWWKIRFHLRRRSEKVFEDECGFQGLRLWNSLVRDPSTRSKQALESAP